jgi:amino acid adenylation domain-containing protein/thioester reductase-like protein
LDNSLLQPLTLAQKSIWNIEKFYSNTSYVNVGGTVLIYDDQPDFSALSQAVNFVIEHNEALRFRILYEESEPRQYVTEYSPQVFALMDFTAQGENSELRRWASYEMQKPFVRGESLYEFILLRGEDFWGFFFKIHHIVSDAWTVTLIIDDILNNYWAFTHDQSPVSTRDSYLESIQSDLEYCASEKFENARNFWSNEFCSTPELTLLKPSATEKLSAAERRTFKLSQELTKQIQLFCKNNGTSVFILLFSTVAILISKMTEKKDIVLGTPVLNRSNMKQKNTMGVFIHNIPFRLMLSDSLNFLENIRNITATWKKLLRFQRYPYELILKEYRQKHQTKDRLFDIVFSYQNAKINFDKMRHHSEWFFNGNEINSLSIHASDREKENNLTIDYDYIVDLFSEEEINQIHQHLITLLKSILSNPYAKIAELEVLSPEEKDLLITGFNETAKSYSQEPLIYLFQSRVKKHPSFPAVRFEGKTLSYSELDQYSNQLARRLREKGVTPKSIVALSLKRSSDIIISILAVLKAGATYLPIDPNYPQDRISFMLSDSGCQIVLTHHEVTLPSHVKLQKIYLDDSEIYTGELTFESYNPHPEDPAYIIYTSGSTGLPKGVIIPHIALLNFIHAVPEVIEFKEGHVMVSVTTISFDIFFLESILPLLYGLTVIIANEDQQKIPQLLLKLLVKVKANLFQTTPSLMRLLLKEKSSQNILTGLSKILIGGEQLPLTILTQLKQLKGPQIYNLYGPTETTIWSAISELTQAEKVHIGKPIGNTQIYILDSAFNPVEIGRAGELFISGRGLAKGYLNNKKLTAERFIPNPFFPERKMYRTGDVGRWLPDGTIEILGRNDSQIKIRGYRIELGEIENALLKYPSIRSALVLGKQDRADHTFLCAYYVSAKKLHAEKLRTHLSTFLPEYMIPTYFIYLDEIPLTPNGKANHKALPEPQKQDLESRTPYVAPRNSTEKLLVDLWSMALDINSIGIDDNLFVLGGDSLTIIEILSNSLHFNLGITAQDFYEYPTIRLLSTKIQDSTHSNPPQITNYPLASSSLMSSSTLNNINTQQIQLQNILLTGATGFLGIHILYELLNTTESKIYCLIRGSQKKLRKLFNFYFPHSQVKLSQRIVILKGDLCAKELGLSPKDYITLTSKIDTVIHCAANVKHFGNYSDFHLVNVQGTEQLIHFCSLSKAKLCHISTTSVLGLIPNEDASQTQKFAENVYIRSKWDAEQKVLQAIDSGLDAVIFRVGILAGRYQDGQFQENIEENALYLRLRSILGIRLIPQTLLHQHVELTPVDLCAQAITLILKSPHLNTNLFHIFNHKTIAMKNLLVLLRKLNYPVETLPLNTFYNYLTQASQNKDQIDLMTGFVLELSEYGDFTNPLSIQLKKNDSAEFLKSLDFEWPTIDKKYLLKILTYMHNVGFLGNSEAIKANMKKRKKTS